jgi:hypothetical protein
MIFNIIIATVHSEIVYHFKFGKAAAITPCTSHYRDYWSKSTGIFEPEFSCGLWNWRAECLESTSSLPTWLSFSCCEFGHRELPIFSDNYSFDLIVLGYCFILGVIIFENVEFIVELLQHWSLLKQFGPKCVVGLDCFLGILNVEANYANVKRIVDGRISLVAY